MADKYIQRYSAADRAVHWTVAVTFLLLVLTGFGLYEKNLSFLFAIFGGGENAILIHKIAGVVFFFAAMIFSLSHLKDTTHFDDNDAAWIKVMGGYLNKKAKVPPMGKYNTGQKIFGLCVLVTTLVFGLTSLVIWSPANASQGLAQVSFFLHSLCFVVMVAFFVAHIYLGTIGVKDGLRAMTEGRVSEGWAKKYSPKWLEEMKKSGKA
ncbi:formate dehydrogenase subunit gamma [bacterium]|nr:MAG: formate dehydrogenase subunit gamma [bacterium]